MHRDITNGFQLYQSDPSGNYGGWKATAIGANSQGAQNILKQDFKDEITLEEAVKLIIKVLTPLFSRTCLLVAPGQCCISPCTWTAACCSMDVVDCRQQYDISVCISVPLHLGLLWLRSELECQYATASSSLKRSRYCFCMLTFQFEIEPQQTGLEEDTFVYMRLYLVTCISGWHAITDMEPL